MAHELSIRTNGFAEMAYTGETPWHGLGQSVDPDASIEVWQEMAGLDWKAQRALVRFNTDREGSQSEWADNVVIFRSDTKAPLAIVSDGYKVVQPAECLEFFRDLVAESGFRIVTAGALKGGRKIWAQADIGETEAIVGNDLVKGRVLIATSLDGSMRTVVKHVSERVVCANTLGYALREGGKQFALGHRSVFDASAAKHALGLSAASFHSFMVQMRTLATVPVSREQAAKSFAELLDVDPTAKDYRITPTEPLANVVALFGGRGKGSNLPGVKGTAWGWLNAVTEFVDHHARARSTDNRIDSAWFGNGERIKSDALDKALAMAA